MNLGSQITVLIIGLLFWVWKLVAWTAPNNVLHENGLGEMVGAEFVLSFVFGGLLAFFVYRNRATYSNTIFYWTSQLVTGSLFALPVLLLIGLFIYAMFFGLHV